MRTIKKVEDFSRISFKTRFTQFPGRGIERFICYEKTSDSTATCVGFIDENAEYQVQHMMLYQGTTREFSPFDRVVIEIADKAASFSDKQIAEHLFRELDFFAVKKSRVEGVINLLKEIIQGST